MATLYRSPCFLLLPSCKLFFPNQALVFSSNLNTLHLRSRRKGFRICACSAKKSRRRNNVKSNEELCNEIREFVSAVGLPEGHFPTMKEFSAHGRTDLANIVRRRGYKLVRDLLSNSVEAETSEINIEQKSAEQQDAISHHTEGQDEKVEDIVEDSSSTDIRIVEDDSSSASINPESFSDPDQITSESSVDKSSNAEWKTYMVKSTVKDIISSEKVEDMVEDSSSTDIRIVEDDSSSASINPESFSDPDQITSESSVDKSSNAEWKTYMVKSTVKDIISSEKVEDMVEDSSSTDIRIVEDDSSSANINPESFSDLDQITSESSVDKSSNAEWKTYMVKSTVKDIISSEKVEDIVEDSSSTDIHIVEDDSSSASINPESFCDPDQITSESSVDKSSNAEWKTYMVKSTGKDIISSSENKEIQDGAEDSSLSTSYDKEDHNEGEVLSTVEDNSSPERQVLIMVKFHGNFNENLETDSDVIDCIPEKTSDSYLLEEKARKISKHQDEKANVMAENISLPPGVSYSEYPANDVNVVPDLNRDDHSFMPMDAAANTSLEDKVAKFIQDGELDTIGDDVYGTLDERTEEIESLNEPLNETEIQSKSPPEENFEHSFIRSAAASALNGSMSERFRLPVRGNNLIRNHDFSAEDLGSSDMRKDADDEVGKSDNHVQINRLKFLLHQKELELSHMKEQIEKEKISLSNMQMKTDTEITKAQKFISEKEAELISAEEGLSGLVEVNIQYSGEGEIVEVAGSFNGWHHPIKMDPQSSSSTVDSTGSRKSRVWSTILWLYPGLYEIKFIVDGEWTVDEERESITKAGICNNILRVIR